MAKRGNVISMVRKVQKAVSLVFKEGGKVLVLKRSKNKETFPNAWSLPSTYILENENFESAAKRMVKNKLDLSDVYLKNTPVGVKEESIY